MRLAARKREKKCEKFFAELYLRCIRYIPQNITLLGTSSGARTDRWAPAIDRSLSSAWRWPLTFNDATATSS